MSTDLAYSPALLFLSGSGVFRAPCMFDAAYCFGRVEARELVSVCDVCSWPALETRGISCSSGDVVPNLILKK